MSIHVLAPEVAAKIAAGEVVERPVSVVKELLENALDAGARRITIEVRGGGLEMVRITDDGHGIPAQDTALLFRRHATSKLSAPEDLARVATLGFRGEALYSIAAVSRVSLLTRHRDEDVGTAVEAAAGRPLRREPRAAPVGTSVAVRGLFRDFPARLKFLKSPQAEAARVQTVASNYVMAYPGVQFRLISEGREVFTSPGSGALREAVSVVHGAEVARRLLAVAASSADAGIVVEGLVSPPDLSRANRSYVSIFVNGRPVAARSLLYAVGEAYHGLLPEGRHPIAIVKLQVPCEDVDVNVHPAKAEVRFRREDAVFRAVQQAVRETLLAQAPVPTLAVGYPPPVLPSGRSVARRVAPLPHRPGRGGMLRPAAAPQQPPPSPTPLQVLPALRVLGQVQATYIVAEGPDGLYLIDQHAAHERVLYERLRDAAARRSPEVQGLLEPVTAELPPQQAEAVRAHGEALAAYGWVLEEFGPQSFLIRGMPSVLKSKAPSQALIDLLDAIAVDEGGETWEERLAATTACHGAVRAGASLTLAEMQEMVRLLERAREPHTCPHARPTMLHLSASHLERQFGRR